MNSEITSFKEQQLSRKERQVEILKKKMEILRNEVDILTDLEKLATNEKEVDVAIWKLFGLTHILQATSVDSGKSLLGNEIYYEPAVKGKEREFIIDKIMEIITKL